MPAQPLLEVLVLGPLAVRLGGVPVEVVRPLERALLVRLALAGGLPVPDHRLATDLWGEAELARPTERLRVLASRLRAALNSSAALTRANGGYALSAELTDLVAARGAAERMYAAARAGDRRTVSAAAREALARWRGPSLAGLRTIPYAVVEAEHLDGWRLDLQVEALDAELALGAAAEASRELEALAAENPLHERLRCLLALALYRTGRQADALNQLARLRTQLADELGVTPAPDTTSMELRLLRQDPSLLLLPPSLSDAGAGAAAGAAGAGAGWAGAPPAGSTLGTPPPTARAAGAGGDRAGGGLGRGVLTSFVGRGWELGVLVERLARPGLVTLTGGPGAGKSRLGFEAARVVAATGREVRLVELAPLSRASAVLEAVAGDGAGGNDPVPAAAATLDGAVLVLDNAEHLVDPVAELVANLLRRTTALTVLVTSQRPLQLDGEELQPLGSLDPIAASQLFGERCAADVRDADPEQVAAICSAVDRLPLGIELAAGLTRTLTVPQLAERLADRMRLLVARSQGARHPSLVAALDWSHQLLGDAERAVLRRVAIFAGGFTLEAAEQVALDPRDVAPALTELADRSLLVVEAVNGRRFRLLETVRDYALGKLDEAGETAVARAAELRWALGQVRAIGEASDDFATAEAVADVFAEWPNLLDTLDAAAGTDRAADGLRLAMALHTPWLIRGWYAEAARHFAALSNPAGVTRAERITALSNHGFVLTMQTQFDQAAELLTEAEELARQQDDDARMLTVLYYRGIVEIERGHLRSAFEPLLTGESLARSDPAHERRLSSITDALGTLYLYTGQAEQARSAYETCIAADRAYGDEHGLSRSLSNLAGALVGLGRLDEALETAAESDHYARRLDDRQILPLNDAIRASVALARGAVGDAEKHLRSAVEYAAADNTGITLAHVDLADVLILCGELAEAEALLEAVFAEAPEYSTAWLAARPVAAALALAQGDLPRAARLVTQTRADHTTTGFAWPRYTTRLTTTAEALEDY